MIPTRASGSGTVRGAVGTASGGLDGTNLEALESLLSTQTGFSLRPPSRAGPLTTPQASRHATDRIVAPLTGF